MIPREQVGLMTAFPAIRPLTNTARRRNVRRKTPRSFEAGLPGSAAPR
jgi:hypothetical protein